MLKEIDVNEIRRIDEFKNHAFLSSISDIKESIFRSCLLQRIFISFEFTRIYDMLINAIDDDSGRKIAREILREEYPDKDGNKPSHREDLFNDLVSLGFSRSEIFGVKPSAQTSRNISNTISAVREITLRDDSTRTVAALAFLRSWGEILTAEEYRAYWKGCLKTKLKKHGALGDQPVSVFYVEHMIHDTRKYGFHEVVGKPGKLSHADRITKALVSMIGEDRSKLEIVIDINDKSTRLKEGFYNQFL